MLAAKVDLNLYESEVEVSKGQLKRLLSLVSKLK